MHETRELCCLLLGCIRGQRAVVQPLVSGWVVFVRNHRDRGRDEGAHGATMQTRRRSRMENIRARGRKGVRTEKKTGKKRDFFCRFFWCFLGATSRQNSRLYIGVSLLTLIVDVCFGLLGVCFLLSSPATRLDIFFVKGFFQYIFCALCRAWLSDRARCCVVFCTRIMLFFL